MSADGQRTKCHKNIAENFNRLSSVQLCTSVKDRQTTGRRTGDSIANVNMSSRLLKIVWFGGNYWSLKNQDDRRVGPFDRVHASFCSIWATVCKTVRPMLSDRCLSCLSCLSVCMSVCDVRALWPNGWTDQDETRHAGRPWRCPHCVRWGSSSPSPKGAQPPIFGPYLLRPNGCMDQDVTSYGARPWPRRLCARWGPRSHLPQKGTKPHQLIVAR